MCGTANPPHMTAVSHIPFTNFSIRIPALLILLLITALTPSGTVADGNENERPNVILILCDDMGFSDLGCYGSSIDTPNLDALANNGVRFTDFHNNAKCSETRATLMTGLWHQQTRNLKSPNHTTLARLAQSAGYETAMVGKWHLNGNPIQHGFSKYFGFLSGTINFFTGTEWNSGKNNLYLGESPTQAGPDFYSTDAFTDYAIQFTREMIQSSPDKPFFLYLAYNAPHFPLQAKPQDIRKYRGHFDEGWDVLRNRRFRKMLELGLIDANWKLPDRDRQVESWDRLNPAEKAFLLPMMEVYAAMIDCLDQNIGKLVNHLAEIDRLDNTLIIFLSDNGACPYQRLKNDTLIPGGPESQIAYDARWANLCNTPLRLYKQYAHHGGTQTPMIVHWPQGIEGKFNGSISRSTGHIVDIMPTLAEVFRADYPAADGILPMEGRSLLKAFRNPEETVDGHSYFWDFNAHHAVRTGQWKLVAERSKEWELYNLSLDRTEISNIANSHPDIVQRLSSLYDKWATSVGAMPHSKSRQLSPSSQSQIFDLKSILHQE